MKVCSQLTWLYFILAIASCQFFSFYDSQMQPVTSNPTVIVDQLVRPSYIIVNTPGPAAYLWKVNGTTRNQLQTISNDTVVVSQSWSDNSTILLMAESNYLGVWKLINDQLWLLDTTADYPQKALISSNTSFVYTMYNMEVGVMRLNTSTGNLSLLHYIRPGYSIIDIFFGTSGLAIAYDPPNSHVIGVYRYNPSSGRYLLAVNITLTDSTGDGNILSGNSNSSVLVYYIHEQNNYRTAILVSFGSGYIQLPSISNPSYLTSMKMNTYGNAIAAVTYQGEIIVYSSYRKTDGSTPGYVPYCFWYFTAYVCNCSYIPNSNSTGQNLSCTCQSGYVWSNYSCLRCSSIPNAVATDIINNVCICTSGFNWNNTSFRCERACQNDTHSKRIADSVSPDQCVCNSGYTWKSTACSLDCSQISQADSSAGVDSCNCASGYTWDSNGKSCAKNGSNLALILGLAIPLAVLLTIAVIGVSYCFCCRRYSATALQYPSLPTRAILSSPAIGQSAQHLNVSQPNIPMRSAAIAAPRRPPRSARELIQEQICSICLMEQTNCTTNCGHRFHRECLRLWMMKEPSCPYCRRRDLRVS